MSTAVRGGRSRVTVGGGVALGVVALLLCPGVAVAGQPQPSPVSTWAVSQTPQLVSTAVVPRPHVDAIAELGSTVFAAGLFDTVVDSNGSQAARSDIMAFDKATGAVSTSFTPQVSGQVWALATDPATNSVYVGGEFTTVNGVASAALVKLDATTGAIDPAFKPPFSKGRVHHLELTDLGGVQRLVVAGGVTKKLLSLDPATGADDGYFTSAITDPIPNAWGGVAVYHIAIDPSHTHLVATGNFQTVDGQPRSRFFMMDLGDTHATLDDWYYPGFAKPCTSTAPRRIAYLQGVDWAPDGTAFDITATGQIPAQRSDIWYQRLGADNLPDTTVCDAAGRFALADPTKPLWINYTGGDSVWAASDTGGSVYFSGHFRYLDNPDGYATIAVGDKKSGAPAVKRGGIGAIDPATGLANSWNPGLSTTKMGGKSLLATTDGLWVGNDATAFHGVPHYGLAFAPLSP